MRRMRPVSSLNSRPRFLAVAFSLALACGTLGSCQPGFTAEDASLDSVWMDQADKNSKTPPVTSPPPIRMEIKGKSKTSKSATAAVNSAAAESSGISTQANGADTSAPMCTVDAFKNSALVSKGGWPGVGPFKSNDGASYVDDNQNKVTLELSGDRITRAELTLSNHQISGNAQKDLLDMQMHIDFLLEAVGIKPKKIQDLNALLDQNKSALLRNDDTPLNLTTGRFLINIEKHKEADTALDYVVAVNSLDADKKILKEHSLSDDPKHAPSTVPDQHTTTFSEPSKNTGSDQPKPIAVTQEGLKDQFATLIRDWQSVKKNAVRTWQTQDLATVLSGKALVRQTDAVKWLLTNKKYYDMSPKGVQVERFTEVLPAKKYSVAAQVHEAYKFIDEPTGQILKEVDDVNRVTYTVERQNGRWVITDSALQVTPLVNKSPNNKPTTH